MSGSITSSPKPSNDQGRPLGPEATLAREIEEIGKQVFGTETYKQVWEYDSFSKEN